MFEHRSGKLWGASLPESRRDLEQISKAGVKVVVSLESRYGFPDFTGLGLEHYKIPVPDFGIPTHENVREFMTILQNSLNQEKPVLVHCLAGCGRTGTMLALAEVYFFGERDGHSAINNVRNTRPCAIETDGQEKVIHEHAKNPAKDLVQVS